MFGSAQASMGTVDKTTRPVSLLNVFVLYFLLFVGFDRVQNTKSIVMQMNN